MPRAHLTTADLVTGLPRDLGVTNWITIQQARVDLFAEATEDHQWIHVDPIRAASGPFGATIAHGYLTLSLVPHLLEQLLAIVDEQRGVNYGIDKVRFTSPVPVGSEIRMAAHVLDAQVRADGGVKYRVAIRIDVRAQDRPALVGEATYVSYPDDSSLGSTSND